MNTEERVDEAMDNLQTTADDNTESDEDQLVTQFMASGCGCSKVHCGNEAEV